MNDRSILSLLYLADVDGQRYIAGCLHKVFYQYKFTGNINILLQSKYINRALEPCYNIWRYDRITFRLGGNKRKIKSYYGKYETYR